MQAGDPLPPFSLAAAVSGVVVDNQWLAGRKAIIVLHGSKTSDAAKEASKLLRSRETDAAEVAYVSIVDLRPFAGLWKKVAEAQLKSSYAKLAEKATAAGLEPRDHVVICPDWDGSVCLAFGVAEPDKQAAIVAVGADGIVLGSVGGAEAATAVAKVT